MNLQIITERELRIAIGSWMLQNSVTEYVPPGISREDYLETFRLPEVNYIHTQTCLDENGDAISTLKAVISLRDWQTKGGRQGEEFIFYKILKTFTDTPDVEPAVMGYIIV